MTERRCFVCGATKPLTDFPIDNSRFLGWAYHCKDCHNNWSKDFQKAHPEQHRKKAKLWRDKNPDKTRAHRIVRTAIAKGSLTKPNSCESCGGLGRIHAHHDDYSAPLIVIWLCALCHRQRHQELEVAA